MAVVELSDPRVWCARDGNKQKLASCAKNYAMHSMRRYIPGYGPNHLSTLRRELVIGVQMNVAMADLGLRHVKLAFVPHTSLWLSLARIVDEGICVALVT